MPSTTEIIFKLLKEQKITAKEVANATGIAQSSFTDWKKGRSKPSYGALVKLADYFGVPVDYLEGKISNVTIKPKPRYSDEAMQIAGWWDRLDDVSRAIIKGEILRRLEDGSPLLVDTSDKAVIIPNPATMREPIAGRRMRRPLMLPVAGHSAAGLPIEMIDANEDAMPIEGEASARLGDFVVIAVGDSMVDAGIRDGAKCIIRPQPAVENGQIALVAVDDGSTIKRFYADADGYRLVPCNPKHQTQHYPSNAPVRVLGRVISIID